MKLDRRQFLHDTAALVASLSALQATTARAADEEATPKPGNRKKAGANDVIRLAVIGVRGRGMEHLRSFSDLDDARITTICDVDRNVIGKAMRALRSTYGTEPRFHQDLRRVLDDKDIDAVSIATPNHWHALATIWACQAGKDVYVEKPVSRSRSGWCLTCRERP